MHHRRPPLRRPHHRKLPHLPAPEALTPILTAASSGLQTLTLIYHEDFEDAISAIVRRQMVVVRYTKIRDVIGARTDLLQEADYAPLGRNHLLLIVAERDTIQALAQEFQALRQTHGHGLRGYITPVDSVI